MKKNESVAKIMTTEPVTVHHGASFSEVRRIFQENQFSHLPVVNGSELIGIISWNDLLRVSFGDAFDQDDRAVDVTLDHTFEIEDVMTEAPRTITPDHSVRDAAEILSTSPFHALPVVKNGNLVGIVSSQDLIKYLLSLY